MRYLITLLFSISVAGQTATLESFGGVANNTGVNNASAWASAISANAAGNLDILVLEGGSSYNFDSTVNLHGANNLVVRSSNTTRATMFSDNLIVLINNTSNSNNVDFEYIKFESTYADGDSGAGNNNALVYISNSAPSVNNYSFDQCEWTAPNCNTNAMKVYVQNGESLNGITVTNSYIHDMGRMGLETVNHDDPRDTDRVQNITFENNIVEDIGLSPIGHGMGISLSGRTRYIEIHNNQFISCKVTGVEQIGVKNANITNNHHSGLGSPIHLVNGSGFINNEDILIANNESTIEMEDGMVFIQVTRLTSRDNIFRSQDRHYMQGVSNSTFTNDYYSSNKTAVFQYVATNNAVSNSNVTFTNCRLDRLNGGTMMQTATSGSLSLVGCELYNTTNTFTEGNVSYTNVGNWLNGVYQGSQGGDINNHTPRFSFVGNTNSAPSPTCDDGIQNGTETGIDCGGSCTACPPEYLGSDLGSFLEVFYNN